MHVCICVFIVDSCAADSYSMMNLHVSVSSLLIPVVLLLTLQSIGFSDIPVKNHSKKHGHQEKRCKRHQDKTCCNEIALKKKLSILFSVFLHTPKCIVQFC